MQKTRGEARLFKLGDARTKEPRRNYRAMASSEADASAATPAGRQEVTYTEVEQPPDTSGERRTGVLTEERPQVEITIRPIPGVSGGAGSVEIDERTFHSEVPYPQAPVSITLPPPQEGTQYGGSPAWSAETPPEGGVPVGAPSVYDAEEVAGGTGPVARPPPQVMTALGPMPLPAEIRKKIPEKFVAKPIVEEREIYVAKKEVQERTVEVPHVHYEHKFAEVATKLKIKKLVPRVTEVIKEVPREVYKPVIEEKVIEVPQGVKYVEVPVEVPCMYPPKIVPKPKIQVVERVVETIKPVVKEKIIEVPQTVVKQIPKIKTVEVPYYVPRYVEKVIEIPYQPPDAATLPPLVMGGLPSRVAATMPTPFQVGPLPVGQVGEFNLPYEAKVDIKVSHLPPSGLPATFPAPGLLSPQSVSGTDGGAPTTLMSPGSQAPAIELPEGFQWGPPPNAPPLLPPSCMPANGSVLSGRAGSVGEARGRETSISSLPGFPPGTSPGFPVPGSPIEGQNVLNMPPMMITCPPEVGNVQFSGYLSDPDILTRSGVMAYQGFKRKGTFQMLFPPLAPQPGVPMNPPGTPDVRTLDQVASHAAGQEKSEVLEALYQQAEAEHERRSKGGLAGVLSACAPCESCAPEERPQREIVYEQ